MSGPQQSQKIPDIFYWPPRDTNTIPCMAIHDKNGDGYRFTNYCGDRAACIQDDITFPRDKYTDGGPWMSGEVYLQSRKIVDESNKAEEGKKRRAFILNALYENYQDSWADIDSTVVLKDQKKYSGQEAANRARQKMQTLYPKGQGLRTDWHQKEVKGEIQNRIVRKKCENTTDDYWFRKSLLATGDIPIFEDTAVSHSDNDFGAGDTGNGKNFLGKSLMRVREELKKQEETLQTIGKTWNSLSVNERKKIARDAQEFVDNDIKTKGPIFQKLSALDAIVVEVATAVIQCKPVVTVIAGGGSVPSTYTDLAGATHPVRLEMSSLTNVRRLALTNAMSNPQLLTASNGTPLDKKIKQYQAKMFPVAMALGNPGVTAPHSYKAPDPFIQHPAAPQKNISDFSTISNPNHAVIASKEEISANSEYQKVKQWYLSLVRKSELDSSEITPESIEVNNVFHIETENSDASVTLSNSKSVTKEEAYRVTLSALSDGHTMISAQNDLLDSMKNLSDEEFHKAPEKNRTQLEETLKKIALDYLEALGWAPHTEGPYAIPVVGEPGWYTKLKQDVLESAKKDITQKLSETASHVAVVEKAEEIARTFPSTSALRRSVSGPPLRSYPAPQLAGVESMLGVGGGDKVVLPGNDASGTGAIPKVGGPK